MPPSSHSLQPQAGLHYITVLTKPQIARFLKSGVFQLAWFVDRVYEVEEAGLRYILRCHPQRAAEIAAGRQDKHDTLTQFVSKQNAICTLIPMLKWQWRCVRYRRNWCA